MASSTDDEKDLNLLQETIEYIFINNFDFLKDEFISESSFFNLCKHDYCTFVDNLFKSKFIDINKKEIYNILLM